MNSSLLSAIGIITAVTAMLATAWQGYLLRSQLVHSVRVSRAQLYQQLTAMCIQRDQIFIDHPELWAYFHEGRSAPKRGSNRVRALATARIIANIADTLESETVSRDFDQHWNGYLNYMYDNSPSFRSFWSDHGKFFPERTQKRFAQRQE